MKDNTTIETIQRVQDDFTSQAEKIKSRGDYVRKGLDELRSLLDKIKRVDEQTLTGSGEKDIFFAAYYDNMRQMENETKQLDRDIQQSLDTIGSYMQEGDKTIFVS
jgi:hypothetical protein